MTQHTHHHTKDEIPSGKVLNIPAGISFSDALASYVFEQAGQDPLKLSEYLILLPSRRSCRTIRDAFLRQSQGKPLVMPDLRPLGEVDAEELSLHLFAQGQALDIPPAISPLRRQIILARTIMTLYEQILPQHHRPHFEQATMLAAELSRFLDQVQTENLSFENLKNLVPEEFATHWQITLDFLKILTENWPKILQAYHCIDPAERRNRLLKSQSDVWTNAPIDRPVIAAGSIASIPAVRDLIKTITTLPQGKVILPGLDPDLDDEAWSLVQEDHPQFFLTTLIDDLGISRKDVQTYIPDHMAYSSDKARLWSEVMRPAQTTQHWRRLAEHPISAKAMTTLTQINCQTPQDEAETIALILRETIETPEKTAAVVTPDRNLALRISAAMRRWDITIDDSAGASLHLTPVGSWALHCVTMIAEAFAPIALLTALRHPLSALGYTSKDVQHVLSYIEQIALRGPQTDYGLEYLIDQIKGYAEQNNHIHSQHETALKTLDHLKESTQPLVKLTEEGNGLHPFADYLRAHLLTLEEIAKTDQHNGPDRIWRNEDGEALSLFFGEILQLADDLPDVTLNQYSVILKQFMSQKTVRPKYGMHPRVSILGQMEARLYGADTIILAGLNEGSWPLDTGADPWMSRQMRHHFGLPAHEQSIGISAHDFVQLACASKVIMTRAEKSGGSPTLPARWLLRLETVLSALDMPLQKHTSLQYLDWRKKLDTPAKIAPIRRPAPKPPIAARPRKISVTGVERLMRDPYEIYAKYILNLRALDEIDANPAAAERGQLLHKILENFIRTYQDTWPNDALNALLDIGRTEFKNAALPQEVESFWWPRFERLSTAFIAHEQNWRHSTRPLATEVKGSLQLNSDCFPVTLTAIADRIDQNKDQRLCIIDYKSGAPPSTYDIEHGYAPQMWLEALIAAKGGFENIPKAFIDYIAFWTISGGTPPFQEKKISSDDFAQEVETIETNVTQLISTFNHEHTPYLAQPNPDAAPQYTDYTHLERVQEWIFDDDIPSDMIDPFDTENLQKGVS